MFSIFRSPLGKTLAGFLGAFNIRPPGQGATLSGAPQSQSYQQRREEMAEAAAAPDGSANPDDQETYIPSPSKRKVYKYSDTPITYKDVDVRLRIPINYS